jgi:hypothetical protein
VDFGGDWLLVGAIGEDDGATQAGAAYTFEFGSTFATPYCFGDGSGAACPCGNESSAGSGEGCTGNDHASRLRAFGGNDLAADDLRILGDYGQSTTVMLFAGSNALGGGNGIPFAGGLLCVSGDVRRMGVRQSSFCDQAEWGPGLAGLASWSPGQSVQFQSWVRAPGSGCNAGFTFSSALEVLLAP